jgi:hypothetical protein
MVSGRLVLSFLSVGYGVSHGVSCVLGMGGCLVLYRLVGCENPLGLSYFIMLSLLL